MRLVFLHSPLLGPLTWRAVAEDLRGRGVRAETPAWRPLAEVQGDFYGARALGQALAEPDGG